MSYSRKEFEALYRRNVPRCMRLAMSLLGDEDDARDVVQDVFVKLWEADAQVGNAEAFLVRSVRNACLDRLRRMELRERICRQLPIEPVASDEDPEERRKEVLSAMERVLTERERQVVGKVYGEGLSYRDAAESLEVSAALVNKCLVSAMKSLRIYFKGTKK